MSVISDLCSCSLNLVLFFIVFLAISIGALSANLFFFLQSQIFFYSFSCFFELNFPNHCRTWSKLQEKHQITFSVFSFSVSFGGLSVTSCQCKIVSCNPYSILNFAGWLAILVSRFAVLLLSVRRSQDGWRKRKIFRTDP